MTNDQLNEAREAFDAGNHRAARDAALRALDGSPDDVDALRIAGRAGVELGLDEAEDELRRITELAPDHTDAWLDLGDALAAAGRTEEANAAFRRVLESEPDNPVALAHLGHAAATRASRTSPGRWRTSRARAPRARSSAWSRCIA